MFIIAIISYGDIKLNLLPVSATIRSLMIHKMKAIGKPSSYGKVISDVANYQSMSIITYS